MGKPKFEPRTISVPAAGKLLGIGRNAAYEAVKRDELPGVIKIGKRILVSRAALERMLNGERAS